MIRNAFLIFASLHFICMAATASPVVHAPAGTFVGVSSGDVDRFAGIAYAQPPLGALRWKAPRIPLVLSGTVDATKFKSACAQLGNPFAGVPSSDFGKPVGSEDCLYLNVWQPLFKSAKATRRPVVVWIHGGSNTKGTSSDPLYDGTRLSREANVVFVSMNYRLGPFGALYLPALHTGNALDNSGNFTTLDLIRTLDWVQENISAFGGDPSNITIIGQSAGAVNVWGLLQSPLAKGKFARAVSLSGLPNSYPKLIAENRANEMVEALLKRDHLEDAKFDNKKIRNYLNAKSTAEILNASQSIIPIQHIGDGTVLPTSGLAGLTIGNYNAVPMIISNTLNETTYFEVAGLGRADEQTLWRLMSGNQKAQVSDFMYEIQLPGYIVMHTLADTEVTASISTLAMNAALHSPVYRKIFSWNELPVPWDTVVGSFHGLDLPFLFGNFIIHGEHFTRFAWTPENGISREQEHERTVRAYKGYFEAGDPNLYLREDERWPH